MDCGLNVTLLPDERLDRVNEKIILIQKKDGLTFGTDAFLLAAFTKGNRKLRAAELGCGTGIISLLCAARNKFAHIDAFEIHPAFADIAERNTALNGLDGQISVKQVDIRLITSADTGGEVDIVFANPPYMRTDSGRRNDSEAKYIARHEVCGNIADFCSAAGRLLKHGGKFYCVFRPDRLTELICALSANRLAPKVLTFVHSRTGDEPSAVLVSASKGGAPALKVTAPLFIYKGETGTQMSDRAAKIYDTMSFD